MKKLLPFLLILFFMLSCTSIEEVSAPKEAEIVQTEPIIEEEEPEVDVPEIISESEEISVEPVVVPDEEEITIDIVEEDVIEEDSEEIIVESEPEELLPEEPPMSEDEAILPREIVLEITGMLENNNEIADEVLPASEEAIIEEEAVASLEAEELPAAEMDVEAEILPSIEEEEVSVELAEEEPVAAIEESQPVPPSSDSGPASDITAPSVLDSYIGDRALFVMMELIAIVFILTLSSVIRNKFARPLPFLISLVLTLLFVAIPMLATWIIQGYDNFILIYLSLFISFFVFRSKDKRI